MSFVLETFREDPFLVVHNVEVRTRGDGLRHGKVGHQRPSVSDGIGVVQSPKFQGRDMQNEADRQILSACLLCRESRSVVWQMQGVRACHCTACRSPKKQGTPMHPKE